MPCREILSRGAAFFVADSPGGRSPLPYPLPQLTLGEGNQNVRWLSPPQGEGDQNVRWLSPQHRGEVFSEEPKQKPL